MIEVLRRKGRTSRRRSRRFVETKCQNLSYEPSVILLVQWMCNKGWKPTCKLRLVSFHETGRGLQALNGVKTGDILVSIPEKLLITVGTVFCNFGDQLTPFVISEHQLLALFVVLHSRLGHSSEWYPYFLTLPKSFSTLVYCNDNEIDYLPPFLQEIAISQIVNLKEAFEKCHEYWENFTRRKGSHELSSLNFSEFRTAWYLVNTRAVYMEKRSDVGHSFTRTNSSMALAPFLDMFNHSFSANVKAGFNQTNGCYEIQSLTTYSPWSQVFINYGPHDNLKLYVEYGFYLPGNPHDRVIFELDDIISYIGSLHPYDTIQVPKMKFLNKHHLLKNLSCSHDGLSWNMCALIFILAAQDLSGSSFSNIFRGDWSPLKSNSEKLMALRILKCRRIGFIENQNRMKSVLHFSDSFQVALNILQEYINILFNAETNIEI